MADFTWIQITLGSQAWREKKNKPKNSKIRLQFSPKVIENITKKVPIFRISGGAVEEEGGGEEFLEPKI